MFITLLEQTHLHQERSTQALDMHVTPNIYFFIIELEMKQLLKKRKELKRERYIETKVVEELCLLEEIQILKEEIGRLVEEFPEGFINCKIPLSKHAQLRLLLY